MGKNQRISRKVLAQRATLRWTYLSAPNEGALWVGERKVVGDYPLGLDGGQIGI